MKAIISVGLPGSGKSTLFAGVRNSGLRAATGKSIPPNTTLFSGHYSIILNRDDVREEMVGETGMNSYYSAENADVRAEMEKTISDKLSDAVTVAANCNLDIVSTDTNINPFFREKLVERLTALGFSVEYYIFDIPLDVCLMRNYQRTGWKRLDESIIRSMYSRFVEAKASIEAGKIPYRIVNTAGEVSELRLNGHP